MSIPKFEYLRTDLCDSLLRGVSNLCIRIDFSVLDDSLELLGLILENQFKKEFKKHEQDEDK